jgi:hypothetical protein
MRESGDIGESGERAIRASWANRAQHECWILHNQNEMRNKIFSIFCTPWEHNSWVHDVIETRVIWIPHCVEDVSVKHGHQWSGIRWYIPVHKSHNRLWSSADLPYASVWSLNSATSKLVRNCHSTANWQRACRDDQFLTRSLGTQQSIFSLR